MPGSRSSTKDLVLANGKVLVLLLFCLANPFAGWAYLAQGRHSHDHKPPYIVDTLKPTRLAVLPLAGEGELDADWTDGLVVDFASSVELDVVPLRKTDGSLDTKRDVLALGRAARADFVLDATASLLADELRLFARLIRVSDSSVRWAELYLGAHRDLPRFREAVCGAVLATLSFA